MKVRSLVEKLLLIGAITSMSCIPAFAAENNNKDVKDTGNYKTTYDKESDQYITYYLFKGDDGYSESDYKNLPQVKFQKEDGKIVYEINNEKRVFDTIKLNDNNLEIKEDGSLAYLDQDGHKLEYKLFHGTINGEEVNYGGEFATENNNKDAKDNDTYTTTTGDGAIKEAYSEADLKNLSQVKFQKEDGKIVYKINNEKKVFDAEKKNVHNVEVKEDGSVVFLNKDEIKIQYQLFHGTINGQEVNNGVVTELEK